MEEIDPSKLPESVRQRLPHLKFDQYGIRIEDFSIFKPIPYYTEPEDESELTKKLESIERAMKSYKYWEDIPRLEQSLASDY
jgi:hypothetical protein